MKIKLRAEIEIELPEGVSCTRPILLQPKTVQCAALGHGAVTCRVVSVETTNWMAADENPYLHRCHPSYGG